MNHVSVSPTNGNGPTKGQRKTMTRVGIEPTTFALDHRCSAERLQGQTGAGSYGVEKLVLHITLYSVKSVQI